MAFPTSINQRHRTSPLTFQNGVQISKFDVFRINFDKNH